MVVQTEIDFDNIVHTHENNSHSEVILFEQYERLSNNCRILYAAFCKGEILTGMDIMTKYGMCEYRKRIQEINIALVQSGREKLKEETLSNGAKKWWK